MNQRQQWEVDRYNDIVRTYNNSCRNKSYRETDGKIVDSELTPVKREFLHQEGVLRLKAKSRSGSAADVRKRADGYNSAAPGDGARETKRIPRWGDLITTGKTKGRWYEVKWNDPSLENVLRYGWVLGGLLERGSGELARFEHCENVAGQRAKHNEIVRGREKMDQKSERSLSVKNGTDTDAYIKVIDERNPHQAAITFFIERGRTAELNGLQRGSYKLAFAGGRLFSRGCDTFSRPQPGSAMRFWNDLTSTGWYQLDGHHTVTGGNAQASGMDYDDFDKL